MTNLIPAEFRGETVRLIEKDGLRWLTARDLGMCLGYNEANAKDGIIKLYNRHIDEFTAEDSVTVKLTATDGKAYNTRIFSPSGCHLLSFFANTKRAKDFRAWAKQVLVDVDQPALISSSATTDTLNAHLEQLARGMNVVLTQNQLVHKYIALLEMNQKHKRRIERGDEVVIRQLKEEGMNQSDIARLLRISPASVSLILRGKYPFSDEPHKDNIETVLNNMLERERANVARLLGDETEGGYHG